MDPLHVASRTWCRDNGLAEPDAAARHVDQLVAQARRSSRPRPSLSVVRPFDTIGICGAGVMGTGIALANLRQGIHVRLFDPASEALQRAEAAVAELPDSAESPRGRFEICRRMDQLGDCPIVLETVAENRDLKRHVFEQLTPHLSSDAILATNTSTIPLAELAPAVPVPEQFCGLHFCNPVEHRPLVEIVRYRDSAPSTVEAVVAYAQSIARLPVVVRDSPGFLVNRLLAAYLNEAMVMVCQGADLRSLDRAGREIGMALGPLEMLDMIGVDTSMRAGRRLWEAYPDRVALTPVLPRLVKLGRLGCKSGVGFYAYASPDAPPTDDPRLESILAPYVRRERDIHLDEMRLRLILPMVVEAARVLEEQVVADAADVDLAMLFGLAMACETGGLLFRADRLGANAVLEQLATLSTSLSATTSGAGTSLQATTWLNDLARSGGSFYG